MSESMADHLPDEDEFGPELFECVIQTTATEPEDAVDAEELYGTRHTHMDCVWSPRVEEDGSGGLLIRYPERGDIAFVQESDSGRPVIVEWTPYG